MIFSRFILWCLNVVVRLALAFDPESEGLIASFENFTRGKGPFWCPHLKRFFYMPCESIEPESEEENP